ncbi:MAG TPA: hypothetical protein VEV87_09100 [Chitinophagaceae bacterium]|nr:hypothetical protein [Chitinophagaceae bacterium]
MINFCTLFDSNYLTRGVALYESLERVCPSFHLYVVTFDDRSYDYLVKAKPPHLTPISLSQFEDKELLQVKASRSAAEYCWTCTPSVILYCLDSFGLDSCTYIDADMIFYSNPKVLLDEMAGNSILLTEHRYTKEYDQPNGIYCVQFLCFKNDERGRKALTWWRERCIEWCYARLEDGKFGDQKYLDDWLDRFQGVHILEHLGGGVAPWNVQQYSIIKTHPPLMKEMKSGKEFPLVFFHYHGLKFFTNNVVSCSGSMYQLSDEVKNHFYFPYIETLQRIEKKLLDEGIPYRTNGARSNSPGKWTTFLQFIKERLVLLKIGNISILQLRFLSFGKHYHYYRLENLTKE